MDCALCSKSINKLTDTFVTFSRCSDSDSGCEHFSHLLCTHLAETYVCPICNDGKEEVSFGLKQSDASFSAYKAMKREVEKSSGVFSAWSGANAIKQTLSKYPEETLKANTLLQLLSANIKLADLKECKAESLVKARKRLNFLNCRRTQLTYRSFSQLGPSSMRPRLRRFVQPQLT